MRTCCWVIKPATPETPAEYCGCKTKYTMQVDPDLGIKVRVYDSLCPYHRKADDRAKVAVEQYADPNGGEE